MRTLCVNYDLYRPGQDYSELITRLKSYPSWWRCLKSTWLVRAPLTHAQLRDELLPLLDANDRLLVIDVTGDARAWSGLPENCGAWLRNDFK